MIDQKNLKDFLPDRKETYFKKISDTHINDNNITIGSICHGAQLLISAKVVSGKKISGYYSIEDDINNAGATYSSEPAVQDKNIISSPHYKYLGDWMSLILQNF